MDKRGAFSDLIQTYANSTQNDRGGNFDIYVKKLVN